MTIKLFDVEAQRDWAKQREAYQDKVDKAMEAGKGWPAGLEYPEPPKALVDSADPGQHDSSYGPPMFISEQRPSKDCIEKDGTMQSGTEGYDTRWSFGKDAADKPFTVKKG